MSIYPGILKQLANNDPTLTSLELKHTRISDAEAKALAEVLKTNTTLTDINLIQNQMSHEGAKALIDALKTNTTLTCFLLVRNQIGDEGAKAFAEVLKSNTTLTNLYLSYNQIGDAGAKVLAEALKSNTTLTNLCLFGNQIGAMGAEALADALEKNTTLVALGLGYNQISVAGASALANALISNTTLKRLGLFNSQIGVAGASALANALISNSTLKHLELYDNQIGDEGAKAFIEALKTNTTLLNLDHTYSEVGMMNAIKINDLMSRNEKIIFIKPAWTHTIEHFSQAQLQKAVHEISDRLNIFIPRSQTRTMVNSILLYRYAKKDLWQLGRYVLDQLKELTHSSDLDFDALPILDYAKELARFITGQIDALNIADAEAQSNALVCFVHAYADAGLQKQADVELIYLLNNNYFAELTLTPEQRRAVDLLLLGLSCQYPNDPDFMRCALGAFERLTWLATPSFDKAIGEFEAFLEITCKTAQLSQKALMEKCRESIAAIQLQVEEQSVNIHRFFQPGEKRETDPSLSSSSAKEQAVVKTLQR